MFNPQSQSSLISLDMSLDDALIIVIEGESNPLIQSILKNLVICRIKMGKSPINALQETLENKLGIK